MKADHSIDFTPSTPNTQTAAKNATFAAEVQAEYYQNKTGVSNSQNTRSCA
jgi:hypothetical protein